MGNGRDPVLMRIAWPCAVSAGLNSESVPRIHSEFHWKDRRGCRLCADEDRPVLDQGVVADLTKDQLYSQQFSALFARF
jgi:hypothetical protein